MDDAMLRADCSACAGLCCVALAFDRSELFAFDKAAGEVCRHLDAGDRCAIHARRAAEGMAGCTRYDCHGAGQRVTALFAGRSWRDDSRTARRMFELFSRTQRAHALIAVAHRGIAAAHRRHGRGPQTTRIGACRSSFRRHALPTRA